MPPSPPRATQTPPRPVSARLTPLALTLCAIAAVGLFGSRAEAACTPDPPSDDDAVVCDDTDSTGYDASGATGLTITTDGMAELDESGALDSAILVSDDNSVTIGMDATVTVTEADGFGIRGGDRNVVTNEGAIVVDGANGVAIDVGSLDDPDPIPQIDVTNRGTITLNGANSVGLRSVDNYNLINEADGTITINSSATGGIGMEGRDDNFVVNRGTIVVDAADGRAISIRDKTGATLPNGVVTRSTSVITLNGDRSIAVQIGDNVGAAIDGLVDLNGNETIGLLAGSRIEIDAVANLTNQGTMNVAGDDAFGMKVGDGWIEYSGDVTNGFVPEAPATRNFGTINVTGVQSTGIFAGDETNLTADHNHNSFVFNRGTIDVTGAGAIGISVGGNDILDALDFSDIEGSVFLFSVDNGDGTITGGADAGPLVVFRDFNAGGENRLLNPFGASILADITDMNNRRVAIRGTEGSELIMNAGTIQGDIELLGGDDRYAVDSGATFTGTIFGGGGTDEAILNYISGFEPGSFDLSQLDGFERLRIYGTRQVSGTTIGWTLINSASASFAGITEIAASGRLVVMEGADGVNIPITLGGDLNIDPMGSILLSVDGLSTPLTVGGDAAFDGTLIVERTARLINDGSYRLIQVDGSRGASTFANEILPDTMGAYMFSTTYDADGISLIVIQSSTFADVAQGQNRTAIASHLDGVYKDPTTPFELSSQLDALLTGTGNLNAAFDALSPEPYDAQTASIIEGSRRVSDLLINRPRACQPGERNPWQGSQEVLSCHAHRWSAWLAGIGSYRTRDGFAGHTDYDTKIGGAVFGIDAPPIGELELTFAISSQGGKIDVQGYGESDLVLADISAHAAWRHGPLRLQSVVSWGYGSHDSNRRIQFDDGGTPVDLLAEDDHSSQHVGLSGQAGFLMKLGSIAVEPLVGVDYTWINQDPIRERNAGLFGARVEHREDEVVSVEGGIRLSTVYHHTKYLDPNLEWMDGIWRPTIDLRWRQTVSGDSRRVTARLQGAPGSVPSFSIDAKEDKGGFEIGTGISFVPEHANRLQFDLRYDAYRASHTVEHNFFARVQMSF